MYWVLLWYSAQSHLDEVLIQIGALKKCHDKMIVKAMEIVIATPFGKTHALDSLLGNADGVYGAIHARVGVEA